MGDVLSGHLRNINGDNRKYRCIETEERETHFSQTNRVDIIHTNTMSKSVTLLHIGELNSMQKPDVTKSFLCIIVPYLNACTENAT